MRKDLAQTTLVKPARELPDPHLAHDVLFVAGDAPRKT